MQVTYCIYRITKEIFKIGLINIHLTLPTYYHTVNQPKYPKSSQNPIPDFLLALVNPNGRDDSPSTSFSMKILVWRSQISLGLPS